jgi:hypothetical protein
MFFIIKGKSAQAQSRTQYIRKKDEAFMREGGHRRAAYEALKSRIAVFERQGKNTGEFLEHARRRGFMKTESDMTVVDEVMKVAKKRLPSGEAEEKKENPVMKQVRRNWKKYKRENINGQNL